MLYIKTCGSAFNFVPVGCGEVPKLVLGGNNNFQGTFLPFGQKHPRLIYPRHSTITGFCPQNGLCTADSTGRAAGCGVVQHANEPWQSAVTQAQHAQHAAMQAQRRCRHYCAARGKFAKKYNKRYGYVAQCFADRPANYCALCS